MKAVRHTVAMVVGVSVLWSTGSPARAMEPVDLPLFHRVPMVNNTPHPSVVSTESGFLTAAMETQQPHGQWRAVATLRAPAGNDSSVVLRAGAVWHFIVPGSATGTPAKARLALRVAGGMVYSQTFEAKVDPLSANQTVDCWLARIQPAPPERDVLVAAADGKRED